MDAMNTLRRLLREAGLLTEIWASNDDFLPVSIGHIVAVVLLQLLVDLLLSRLSFLHCTGRLCALFLRLHIEGDEV